MKNIFTKTTGAVTAAATTFSIIQPAFANTEINPCANLGEFNDLCALSTNNLGSMISSIITILFILAALVALFFLIWGGIKWILSGGDKAKVESARSTIIAAILGLAITFLAFFLLTFVLRLFNIDVTSFNIPRLTNF